MYLSSSCHVYLLTYLLLLLFQFSAPCLLSGLFCPVVTYLFLCAAFFVFCLLSNNYTCYFLFFILLPRLLPLFFCPRSLYVLSCSFLYPVFVLPCSLPRYICKDHVTFAFNFLACLGSLLLDVYVIFFLTFLQVCKYLLSCSFPFFCLLTSLSLFPGMIASISYVVCFYILALCVVTSCAVCLDFLALLFLLLVLFVSFSWSDSLYFPSVCVYFLP
jgi:hypothetical protein